MDLLHENCGGEIETFDPEDYGMCTECGEEGHFKVVREEPEQRAVFAMFYYTTCFRETPA